MVDGYRKQRIEQSFAPGASGTLQKIYRLYFFINDDGPFIEEFSEAEFIPERISARVGKVAETVRATQTY